MTSEISKLIDEVNRKIGRNLLRYQYIEIFLKQIIPYSYSENKKQSYFSQNEVDLEELRRFEKCVQSKTFGALIQEFNKFNEIPVDFFEQSIEKTKDERNKLVHNFLEISGVEYLSTVSGFSYALRYLDQKYNEANEFFEFTRQHSLGLLLVKLDTASEHSREAKIQLDQIINFLPEGFEIICESDPSRTVWKSTRIVQLLQLAESQTPKVGELTLLSRAGSFIKRKSPDLSPKEYGLESLKEVLFASGLFEISMQNDKTGGSVVLYKSKS